MRLLACLLICLLPVVTSAQAIASASVPTQEAQSLEQLDVLPVVADEDMGPVFWGAVGAFVVGLVVLYMVLSGDSVGDLGNGLLALAGTVVVCGAFAWCMSGGTEAPEIQVASGATYDLNALAAYATDDLTAAQRQALAEAAFEHGRDGVVLQRLVETRVGVGEAPGAYALEVSVVDAETAQLRPVGEDLLGASSVLSISISGNDLEAAQADVLDRLLTDA